MRATITGRCWVCGDDVTVYQVISEDHWTMKRLDGDAMGDWVFEHLEPGIAGQAGGFRKLGYDIVIAGESFGCGSKSVEHPMAALKGAGVRMIIAESVSRYSYRNAINLALPVLICPGVLNKVHRDDQITVDLLSGAVQNLTTGEEFAAYGLGDFALGIINAGGLLEYVVSEV